MQTARTSHRQIVRGSDMASVIVTVIGLTAYTVLVLWLNSKM